MSEVANSKNDTPSKNDNSSTTALSKRKFSYDFLGIHHKFIKIEPALLNNLDADYDGILTFAKSGNVMVFYSQTALRKINV